MAVPRMNALRILVASVLIGAGLPACTAGGADAASEVAPLAGAKIGGPFTLVNGDGQTVTDRDFAGKYRLMYFGYTFCPDVCPVDMQRLAAGYRKLATEDPARAARLQPIFVTVDPERDTPAVVKQFTAAFDPRFVGLTGSPEAIARVADAYLIPYAKREGATPGSYLVDHGRQAYLMAPDGSPVALIPQDGTPDEIVAELQRWMR
jgi:protein SCO1